VDKRIWDLVQDMLQSASAKRRGAPAGSPAIGPAPLKGKFRDETGDRLTPTHTQSRGKRLRYYVSNRLVSGGRDPSAWRLPAPAFEATVARIVADHLANHARRHAVLGQAVTAAAAQHASEVITKLATQIGEGGIAHAAPLIRSGHVGDGRIRITLDGGTLAEASRLGEAEPELTLLSTDAPFTCRRRGIVAQRPTPRSSGHFAMPIAGQRFSGPDGPYSKSLERKKFPGATSPASFPFMGSLPQSMPRSCRGPSRSI
jgi:hypothetical protein